MMKKFENYVAEWGILDTDERGHMECGTRQAAAKTAKVILKGKVGKGQIGMWWVWGKTDTPTTTTLSLVTKGEIRKK